MTDTCIACGKTVVAVHDPSGGPVSLRMMWVHTSRWVRHRPVVEDMLK